jgi:hypothetical protein
MLYIWRIIHAIHELATSRNIFTLSLQQKHCLIRLTLGLSNTRLIRLIDRENMQQSNGLSSATYYTESRKGRRCAEHAVSAIENAWFRIKYAVFT